MDDLLADHLVDRAWWQLVDPGADALDLVAAEAVLRRTKADLLDLLKGTATEQVLALGPDRLERLAKLLEGRSHRAGGSEHLAPLWEAFRASVELAQRGAPRPEVRRTHSLLRFVFALNGRPPLEASDWAWIFDHDEYAADCFLGSFAEWCWRADPLPQSMASLVTELRETNPDSPALDRLAAWVSPCARGMHDLASWENGFRDEPEWQEACARWTAGRSDDAADDEVLRQVSDPEASPEVGVVRRALERDRTAALEGLRAAHARAEAEGHPVLCKVLERWLRDVGGAS